MTVYRKLLELDFFAPVALTKALLPSMIARGDGHVVMVGSVVSKFGAPLRFVRGYLWPNIALFRAHANRSYRR